MIKNEDVEKEEITEDDIDAMGSGGSEGNATASGKNWDSGVTRGKANPVSSAETWESGVARGKGNPISNHGNWESGAIHGRGNPVTTNEQKLEESLNRMKTIMGY